MCKSLQGGNVMTADELISDQDVESQHVIRKHGCWPEVLRAELFWNALTLSCWPWLFECPSCLKAKQHKNVPIRQISCVCAQHSLYLLCLKTLTHSLSKISAPWCVKRNLVCKRILWNVWWSVITYAETQGQRPWHGPSLGSWKKIHFHEIRPECLAVLSCKRPLQYEACCTKGR